MATGYFKIDTSEYLSGWFEEGTNNPSSPINKKAISLCLRCLSNLESRSEENDLLAWDLLVAEMSRFLPKVSEKSVQVRLHKNIKALIDLGVFTKTTIEDFGKLPNHRYPSLYVLNNPMYAEGKHLVPEVLGDNSTDRMLRSKQGVLDLKAALSTNRRVNYNPEADLDYPASMLLTTMLIAHGSRTSKADTRLEVKTEGQLFNETANIRTYSTGRTDSEGKPLGRNFSYDAGTLYLMQTRDQQQINKRLAAGETDIPNLFTLDAQDIVRELQHEKEKPSLWGNSLVSVSHAILRLAGMHFEAEVNPDGDLAKMLTDGIGLPTSTLHLKHFYLKASGDDNPAGDSKIQRFFTYSYPEHVFRSMLKNEGLLVFHKGLINRRTSGYEPTFYFWLRGVCGSDETGMFTLFDIYHFINFDKWTKWSAFQTAFLKQILPNDQFEGGVIQEGECGQFDFFGYDIYVERSTSSPKTILFKVTGSRIRKEVIMTKQKFKPAALGSE